MASLLRQGMLQRMNDFALSDYRIISGGQTGVDRAALDVAIELSLEYGGWCPQGGWAEDLPAPPGLLALYPNLGPTPLADIRQRTEWNARDADATLILIRGNDLAKFDGTRCTRDAAVNFARRYLILDLQAAGSLQQAKAWLSGLDDSSIINVAGPRESEAPGIYEEAKTFLRMLLS
jgi:hypothetical protein